MIWSSLINGVVSLFTARQAQKKAEIDNKARLLRDENSHNSSWEMAALSADRLSLLRNCSFILFTAPVLYTVYDPAAAGAVWVSLDSVPDWIIGVQMAMTGFIWAAKPVANMGAAIIGRSKGV